MFAIVELRWPGDERAVSGLLRVRFEDSVRIVEVAQDQIEAGEIFEQLSRQLRAFREESGERSRLDRTDRVRIEALLRQRGDVFVTEYFQVRLREPIAQQLDRRQGQNEIADRAAADDEDAIQLVPRYGAG